QGLGSAGMWGAPPAGRARKTSCCSHARAGRRAPGIPSAGRVRKSFGPDAPTSVRYRTVLTDFSPFAQSGASEPGWPHGVGITVLPRILVENCIYNARF